MENKAHALAAGIFVLVVAALLAGLAFWLARDTTPHDFYELTTTEPISGLQPQAQVRFRGVLVGKVAYIGFDPTARGSVLIRLSIDRGSPISTATFATIATQGVTGLGFIQLDEDEKEAPTAKPLPPNEDKPPRIPLRPGFFDKLKNQSEVILDQFEQASTRFNKLLGDDNQRKFSDALDQLGNAAGSISRLALKLDRNVDPALGSLRSGADKVGRAADGFDKVAQRLNAKDGPVDRLAAGSDALAHSAQTFNAITLPRLNRATEEVTRGARQVYRAANLLGDNPRSLIFGAGPAVAGPGEPGFAAPAGGEAEAPAR